MTTKDREYYDQIKANWKRQKDQWNQDHCGSDPDTWEIAFMMRIIERTGESCPFHWTAEMHAAKKCECYRDTHGVLFTAEKLAEMEKRRMRGK